MSLRTSALLVIAAALVALPSASAQTHAVNVLCCGFTDSVSNTNVTTVPVGTTVVWTVLDISAHTVTSGNGTSDPTYGVLFDLPLDQTTPVMIPFNTPGVFPYFCQPHEFAGMNGTVIVTVPAQSTAVGTGCTGSNSQVFTLATQGLPQIGNQSFALDLSGGPANAQAYFFIADSIAAQPLAIAPNCLVYLDFNSVLAYITAGINPLGPFTLSGAGAVSFPVPIGANNGLMGLTLSVQAYAPDNGVPGGAVLTNARTVRFGI